MKTNRQKKATFSRPFRGKATEGFHNQRLIRNSSTFLNSVSENVDAVVLRRTFSSSFQEFHILKKVPFWSIDGSREAGGVTADKNLSEKFMLIHDTRNLFGMTLIKNVS